MSGDSNCIPVAAYTQSVHDPLRQCGIVHPFIFRLVVAASMVGQGDLGVFWSIQGFGISFSRLCFKFQARNAQDYTDA